jgi:hypothetical protein
MAQTGSGVPLIFYLSFDRSEFWGVTWK